MDTDNYSYYDEEYPLTELNDDYYFDDDDEDWPVDEYLDEFEEYK